MVKSKKVKKGLADAVTKKKGGGVQKLNPFDIRTVRTKQNVLGRQKKTKVGQPGQARAKSIQIRKETLLQEYKIKNKSNLFVDKRIGEKDSNLSAEDKMIARFTAEKMRGTGKTSIFNLGEEDDLTHGGLSIDNIEKFDNPESDNDEEEDKKLDAKFVEEAHFGGFMTKLDDEFKSGKANSRKEWIDNLIKESKKRKAEKKKLDEEVEEKTDALDDNWKDMFINVRKYLRGKYDDDEAKNDGKYDAYDMLVRQLTFERKEAKGSDRLKTEQELIKEEKEKLEQLEADRLRRMRGERLEDSKRPAVLSVEDLGDPEVKKKNKMTRKEKRNLLKELLKEEGGDDVDEGDESGEEEESDSDEDEEQDDEGDDDSDSGEEEEEEEDKYSDLEENAELENKPDDQQKNEKDRYDEQTREMIEKATAELPYSFSVPDTYPDFSQLVRGRTVDEVKLIVERIIKCNHPSLAEGNKDKLSSFYPLLLQFVEDCASAYDEEGEGDFNLDKIGLQAIQALMPLIFQLTGMFQAHAAKCVQEVIREKFDQFISGEGRKQLPGLETLIFARLVMLLFPSSDYRHPVVTPTLTLITAILSKARPTDRASFASGLYLASLLTEAVQLSGRYSPELVNFITGVFTVSCETVPVGVALVPPCKGGTMLAPTAKISDDQIAKLKLSDVTSVKAMDDSFRAQCLNSACDITLKLIELYTKLPSAIEIFAPLVKVLKYVVEEKHADKMHEKVSEKMREILSQVEALPAKSGAVVRPAKPVKMLRMLEPEIEENFQPDQKKRKGDANVLEEQKLRYKVRMEKKGARKEIRKDMAFLANQKAKEIREKDEERKERTKRLLNSLANQEGDYQKLQKKKRKKF